LGIGPHFSYSYYPLYSCILASEIITCWILRGVTERSVVQNDGFGVYADVYRMFLMTIVAVLSFMIGCSYMRRCRQMISKTQTTHTGAYHFTYGRPME